MDLGKPGVQRKRDIDVDLAEVLLEDRSTVFGIN